MTQLTRLGLFSLKEAHEKELCFSIERMENLQHLSLTSDPVDPLRVDALSSAPPYLERLILVGKLEKVPHWFKTLLNLKFLTLQSSELMEDVIASVQGLPNLLSLHLSSNAFQGECLRFFEGFQKLKILRIDYCSQLIEIEMAKGVMPSLQRLEVLRCKGFRKLPHGWKLLTHLEQVCLYEVSDELVESICGKGNDGLPAVPYILIFRTNDDDDGEANETKSKWVYKPLN
ncbi:hypothetical protein PTKIN_Ptkin11bG0067300 [Pterospermum kingtungense]